MQKDILWGKVGNFTVNLAVNSVQIAASNGEFKVRAPGIYKYFQPRDHIVIESIAVPFPCCFSSVNMDVGGNPSPLELLLFFNSDLGASFPITELNGGNGYIGIYCENVEIPLDVRVEYSALVSSPRKLKFLGGLNGNVCMLNTPAALNGVSFDIYAYMKVRHTLDITT